MTERPQLVAPKVTALLGTFPAQDEAAGVRISMALSLAMKFDESVGSETAASAVAVPQISKELRAILEEIVGSQSEKTEFVASLFTTD